MTGLNEFQACYFFYYFIKVIDFRRRYHALLPQTNSRSISYVKKQVIPAKYIDLLTIID